jgi:hypothetical protein
MDFPPKKVCGVFELTLLGNAQKIDIKNLRGGGGGGGDRMCVLFLRAGADARRRCRYRAAARWPSWLSGVRAPPQKGRGEGGLPHFLLSTDPRSGKGVVPIPHGIHCRYIYTAVVCLGRTNS